MEENKKRRSRAQIRKNSRKRMFFIISNIILFIIIFILSYMTHGMYKEAKVRTLTSNEGSQNFTEEEEKSLENVKKKVIKMPAIAVVNEYKGYKVDCRLEIPKIKLNTNVLKYYSTEGLDTCVSKYYGPNANEEGNYCIAGHNYSKDNMFNHLIDLELGDSIFLTDNKNGIVEYNIYDIYRVKPQNTKPLSQGTQGKRELTLITCVNYSRNRLVIKAAEKDIK